MILKDRNPEHHKECSRYALYEYIGKRVCSLFNSFNVSDSQDKESQKFEEKKRQQYVSEPD